MMTPTVRHKGFILLAVILMDLLTGMEFDLFVPSFPELKNLFDLSAFWVEALLSVNFIGFCLSLFFVGTLADRYGRKQIILLGLLIFILGSLFCLLAPSYPILLIGRFLQGVGIAAPSILSFLLISDLYPIKQQQYLIAMLNAIMNVAVATAPIAGSYITLYFQWRGNFTALLAFGVFVLIISVLFVPRYDPPKHHEDLNPGSYRTIFQSKPLILVMAHIVFQCIPYWVFVGMSPLLYMKSLGVGLTEFGYYQGTPALIFAFGSLLFGLVIQRFNAKNILIFNNRLFIASLLATLAITIMNTYNPLVITLTLIAFVIGQIIPSIILYPLALSIMPQAKGRVAAVIQGSRLLLTSIALQITGYCYTGSFQSIGIVLAFFMVLSVVTLHWITQNHHLMKES